jgi:hypothetical protein
VPTWRFDVYPYRYNDFQKALINLIMGAYREKLPNVDAATVAPVYAALLHRTRYDDIGAMARVTYVNRHPDLVVLTGYARGIAAWRSTEEFRQLEVTAYLRSLGCNDDANAVLVNALTTVPEPGRRDIRLAVLATVEKGDPGAALRTAADTLVADTDALVQGDVRLVAGDYAGAARLYGERFKDLNAPLPERSAAWAGLLDSDPNAALDAATALIATFPPLEQADVRTQWARWLGWTVWRAVSRDIPLPPAQVETLPKRQPPTREAVTGAPAVSLVGIPRGMERAADVMRQALALSPEAILQSDESRCWADLRLGAAVTLLLGGDPQAAADALTHEIVTTVPPPSYGWRNTDNGMQPMDFDRPRQVSDPDPIHLTYLIGDLVATLDACHDRIPEPAPLAMAAATIRGALPALHKPKPTYTVQGDWTAWRIGDVPYFTNIGKLGALGIRAAEEFIPAGTDPDPARLAPLFAALSYRPVPTSNAWLMNCRSALLELPFDAARSSFTRKEILSILDTDVIWIRDKAYPVNYADTVKRWIQRLEDQGFPNEAQHLQDTFLQPLVPPVVVPPNP